MKKKGPTISTMFFLIAVELLFFSFVVSILVWLRNTMPTWLSNDKFWLYCAFLSYDFGSYNISWLLGDYLLTAISLLFSLILIGASIYSYSRISSDWIIFPKSRVLLTLLAYWLSVIIFYISVVDAFARHFPEPSKIPFWAVIILSVLLIFLFLFSQRFLLEGAKSRIALTPVRVILFRRFVILGNLITWLESGWQSIAIKFIDVLFATWLVQGFSRILWKATVSGRSENGSIFNISSNETLLSPTDPTNGSIFNSFSTTNQSIPILIDYSGHNFVLDIASSIFSLLWNNWPQLVAVWFILEVLGYLWSSSGKVVIVNASEGNGAQAKKNDEKEDKDDSQKAEPLRSNLADILATKLDKINEIYRFVDERRPAQSACGAGEPIDAAIKVERMDEVSLSSTSEIRLGPLSIPANSVSAMISHIMQGPKITIGLYFREQEGDEGEKERETGIETKKEIGKLVLTASMTSKRGSHRWVVDSPYPLDEEDRTKERSIEDMVIEMSHRIYASMQSEKPGQSIIPWKAMWSFNEGMRAYRDSLHTTKKRKYFLNRAEKRFIDALEEHNNFGLAYYNLGLVYLELNQPASAEACFQKAIEVNPDSWDAYYALGTAIFRRAKEFEQSSNLLGSSIEEEQKKRIKDDYQKVIKLCDRVLQIKTAEERLLEKDFSIKAKANDLKGNALVRLASMQPARQNEGNGAEHKKNCPNFMNMAVVCLENAVHCSWMALIKESVLHETSVDEAEVVSECSIDLADAYLKMSKHDDGLRSNARSVLMQAIFVKPMDVNLYYLLARAGEPDGCTDFVARADEPDGCPGFVSQVYEQILRINPGSYRIKAHLASIKAGNNTQPASWLESWQEECAKSGCCDEESYERVYLFLARAIEDSDCSSARRMCFEREKLDADLKKATGKKEYAIPAVKNKSEEIEWKKRSQFCSALCHMDNDLTFGGDFQMALSKTLEEIQKIKEELGISCMPSNESATSKISDRDSWLLSVPTPNDHMDYMDLFTDKERDAKMLNFLENLIVSGSIYMKLARINADNYINDIKISNKIICLNTAIMQNIGTDAKEDEILWVKSSFYRRPEMIFNGYSEIFLRRSQRCMLSAKKILISESGSQNVKSNFSHKTENSYYLVEAGKIFLELGKVRSILEMDDGSCNKCALELFDKAIDTLNEVDPEEIKRNKIRLYLAQAYMACGKLPNALKEAQNAKDLNPLDHEEREVLGEIFCELKEFKFGLSELNTARSYNPDDHDLLISTGKAYFLAGKDCKRKGEDRNRILKNAKDRLDEALEIVDESDIKKRGKIRYWIGRTLLEMGRYEEAIPHLRILAEKDEGDFLPALYLGYAFLKCNSHEECESCLYKLIRSLKTEATFLFSWDTVPGEDYEKLRAFLKTGIDCGLTPKIEKVGDRINIEIPGKRDRLSIELIDEEITTGLIAKTKNCELKIDEKPDNDSEDKAIIDKFCGRLYEDERHITEILARAYIYLAYSYAERDANLCDSWKLAFNAQYYINHLKEKRGHEDEKARDGVLPGKSDKQCKDSEYGFLSVSALKISGKSHSIAGKLTTGYSIGGMDDCKICIIFNQEDGQRKRMSKAHLAECAGTICYKMGELDKAFDYLNASIALYPDAGAYLNLAKTYERMIICGRADQSKKDLIYRKIRDLCRHVEALDLRDEHKRDLKDFRKRWPDEEKVPGSSAGGSPSSGDEA